VIDIAMQNKAKTGVFGRCALKSCDNSVWPKITTHRIDA
jgi:hypothetical protein